LSNRWVIVVIRDHKRLEKNVPDARTGQEVVARLNETPGTQAHLVSHYRAFPIKGEDPDDGRWWCPYCRRWRFFVVPRGDTEYDILDENGKLYVPAYLAMCQRMGLRVCLWCLTSQAEFYVRVFNPGAVDAQATRKRRSTRRKTRH
jgi:hypothetical protein